MKTKHVVGFAIVAGIGAVILLGLIFLDVLEFTEEGKNDPNNAFPKADAGGDRDVKANETVSFFGIGSDSDGKVVKYEWDFDGDGTYDWTSTTKDTATYKYTTAGEYSATLRVTDNEGGYSTDNCTVSVTYP